MEVVLPIIYSLVTLVLGGLGKYYFNSVNKKIEANAALISELRDKVNDNKNALDMNQQADDIYRESVSKDMKEIKDGNKEILNTFNSFLNDYGFVIKKLAAQELGGGG